VESVLADAGIGARQRLCCALSGGVDSVVLLEVLVALRARLGFGLEAAHVHHGLGSGADGWAAFCADLCGARGLHLHVFRVEVARDHPGGLEAAARIARHRALAGVDCDWLVLGHHRDDQAETVLFRLLRGAGVHGVAAMRAIEPGDEKRAGKLRPLLEESRAGIHAYARAQKLQWVEDDSNADPRFTRNDLRLRILPALEAGFPAARAALARAAAHFGEAAALLDDLAAMDMAACGGETFERAALLRLPEARLANLLRWRIRRLGNLPPSTAWLGEALRQLRASEAPLLLPLGKIACYSYRGRVWIAPPLAPPPSPRPWRAAEGKTNWAGGEMRCRAATGAGISAAALLGAECRLAVRVPGLKLRLKAGSASGRFKELCQAAGIPAWLRDHLPVLEVNGRPAWIGGIGIDAAFACAPGEPGWMLEWNWR
jgi:tRNA(Ile)-lysidine synthase